MEPFWTVFYETGDPLAYLMYRRQPAFDHLHLPAVPHPDGKEATPWPPQPTL